MTTPSRPRGCFSYLDDLEAERQDTALLEGRDYTPILAAPYRWQAWAAPKVNGKLDHNAALTGADLIDFVNRDLFPYLRKFRETTGVFGAPPVTRSFSCLAA